MLYKSYEEKGFKEAGSSAEAILKDEVLDEEENPQDPVRFSILKSELL